MIIAQETMFKQVKELLDIHAPSGQEEPVREYLMPYLVELMDEVTMDKKGNLMASKKIGNGEGATILLSAHMDTVMGINPDKVVTVTDEGIFTASLTDGSRTILGADDRAGIAIVLEVLRSIPEEFNGVIKVAFTVEEETGRIGSNFMDMDFYVDVDLAIVVDRMGGSGIVVGCEKAFCSNEVGEYVQTLSDTVRSGHECISGGISDAVVFSESGINTINLSAGYFNEHTKSETLVYKLMQNTSEFVKHILSTVNDKYKEFENVPKYNHWVKPFEYMEDDILFDVIDFAVLDEEF